MTDITVIRRRLYITGLTSNISSDHIRDRFSSFGTVRDVDELQPDALGRPRPYTFLTLDTTPVQLKKCLNIMSGSFWRGAQLKLAEAKPRWEFRIEKERNPDPEVVQAGIAKKRKRSAHFAAREGFGKTAQDTRVPTEDNYASKKFWRLTPSHHLIRPVSMRANHPIVPCPASSSIMKAKRPRAAPSRARRRVIDPSRWDPMHLSKSSFSEYQPAKSQADETWDYESLEDDEEADEDGRAVLGVWRRVVDGEVVEEEVVRGTRLRTSLGSLGNDKDLADNPDTEIFADEQRARPRESTLVDKETSPLFANRHLPLQIPDPAENRSVSPAAESMAESAPSSPLLPQREMSPHSTPPSRPVESARNAEHGPATSLPAPILELAREERSTALQVFGSLLGDVASGHRDPGGNTKKRNEWAGFEESYEEDEEATTPLRLRGGAGSTSSNDSSESGHEDDSTSEDDSSDEEDRSSQDEDEDMDETDETGDGEESADPDPPLTAKPNTLKSLFDPSASTTVSLLAFLNPDLEIADLDVPLAPIAKPSQRIEDEIAPLEPLAQSSSSKIVFDPDPSIPMFFPTDLEQQEQAAGQGFWRRGDDKAMREIWDRDKLGLTREWKQRHRDARKQRRRRGGVGGGDDFE